MTFQLYQQCKGGQLNLGGEERILKMIQSGRLTIATTGKIIDHIHTMMMDDRRMSVNQINNTINISHQRVENTLHNNPGMTNVSAGWVLRPLTPNQNRTKLITSWEHLTSFEADLARFVQRFLI
ncbi:uncharacterized protein LOC115216242 [Octopus sinensis]|uniref:Uncharacterized protein LOC115216242 n=1 Tax=Octopus sinensis TaxID=2607531 RepID=A0A6P7SSV0_9MOLL|nr:uncharacterized protein LOC115216242 [Octopus sinensis]